MTNCVYIVIKAVAYGEYITILSDSDIFQCSKMQAHEAENFIIVQLHAFINECTKCLIVCILIISFFTKLSIFC